MDEEEVKRPLLSGSPGEESDEGIRPWTPRAPVSDADVSYLNINKNTEPVSPPTELYARRWYLQLLVLLLGALQGLSYNMWGPITKSAIAAFDWNNADLAMMPNWGNIAYVIAQVPALWFLDAKGLRWTCVLCSGLLVLSSGLRSLPFHPVSEAYKWSVFSAQIFSGTAFIFVGSAATHFSNTWFPPNQRTLSTTITATSATLGGALAFVVGPLMVPEYTNSTSPVNVTAMDIDLGETSPIEKVRGDIMRYVYAVLVAAGAVFLLVLVYFPARPPSTPSLSAKAGREDFVGGVKALCKSPSFWILGFAFGTLGISFGWITLLDIDLESAAITQVDIGWLVFWSQIVGILVSIPISWLSAVFAGRLKLCIFICMFLTTGSFMLFTAMNQKVIGLPPTTVLLYVSTTGSNLFVNIAYPLFYELFCENFYPVSEGVIAGSISIINNLFGTAFFFVFEIPNIGTLWIDWFVLASSVLCLVALLVVKVKYRRSQVDTRMDLPDEEVVAVGDNR